LSSKSIDRRRDRQEREIHFGDGGDECLGAFWDFCVGGGGAALSVDLLLCL